MQQLDLFEKDSQFYLYGEVKRVETSMNKQTRHLFGLFHELLKKVEKLEEEKNN